MPLMRTRTTRHPRSPADLRQVLAIVAGQAADPDTQAWLARMLTDPEAAELPPREANETPCPVMVGTGCCAAGGGGVVR
jgi:hypothetical protein